MARTTFSGPVASTNGFIGAVTGNVAGTVTLPTYTVTSANALATKPAGQIIYVSNGLGGDPCIAVGDGTNWISPAGTAISAT
jgi:hypothetical protein